MSSIFVQAIHPSQRNANKALIKSSYFSEICTGSGRIVSRLVLHPKSDKMVPVTSALGAVVVNGFGVGIA